ncbi:MAG: acyl--CoA ligase [Deltaproteobacteria bacterium]|nr:acyl--CoA ligase [Deltaproteobacteria bacterium]
MREQPAFFGRHAPESVVAFGDGDVSADRARGAVEALACSLPAAREGERVLVLCRDRLAFLVGFLGAVRAGYVVALPANAQPESIRELRLEAGVRTVIHGGEGEAGFDVRDALASPARYDRLSLVLDSAGPLIVVRTSGTTGAPKSYPKTAGQLLGEAAVLRAAFPEVEAARVLAVVPPYHIYGLLFGLLLPAISGGSFARDPAYHALALADSLRRDQVDVLVSVPAHLRGLRDLAAAELPTLRRVFSSGAPLAEDTARQLAQRFGWSVTEVLGSTETGGIAQRVSGASGAQPYRLFEGVTLRLDAQGHMLLDSPLLDADALRPYRHADRAELLDDGRFLLLGRSDGVIKVGGTRVALAEIEARLRAVEGVEDAAVIAVEVGGARGHATWAAVVAPERSVAELRRALREHLAPVVLPRRYRFVERLPRQESGKLRRTDLLALFDAEDAVKS